MLDEAVTVAVVGSLVLVGLAIWVGQIEGRAVDNAWRRIATSRRLLNERQQAVDAQQEAVDLRKAELDERERRLDGSPDDQPDDEPPPRT